MGGFLVPFQFISQGTKDSFKSHVGVNSWFSLLQQGSLLHEEEEDDSYFHRKRLCIKTSIRDNIFESFKKIVKEDVNDDALSENGKEDSHSEADIIPETVLKNDYALMNMINLFVANYSYRIVHIVKVRELYLVRCQSIPIYSKGVPKDPFPKSYEFSVEHFATLVALLDPFHKHPEPFLCLVGISHYYTLDEDAYLEFLGDDDEERQHAEDKPRLLESTVGHVVSLLLIAPARASSELEASVDKLFDEGASGDRGDADVRPAHVTIDTIVKDVAPLQPRHQRKRKTVVADSGGPSHPPKKLREDYEALGGASTTGKSMSAVQGLFTRAVLDAKDRSEPIPTFPFVTSYVSDSSHHSGANIAKVKVDFIVRSSALAIATVTTVTAGIDTDATATRAPVAPSLFGVGSSLTGRTDSVPGGYSDVSSSDFLIGGIRTVVDPDSDLQKISLNAEVRMRAEYNIRDKRKIRVVVDEQGELLKAKDGEIESLKAQLLLKEAKAAKVIRLRADVFKFESAEQSLRSEVTAVKLQNDNLVGQVHELEASFAGLQEKIAAYEGFVSQLEKFKNEKLEEVNEKFDKLCADFVDMDLHLEEKFYPHLLTTISGRRWLLTYDMGLAVSKCLNSTEYLSALGAEISKAVEKGMQERLSAGITHGEEGRQLADVAAYNPSAKADYLSALQHLQNVNFSLLAELKSNKDTSVDTIMNLLRLDDILVERLGLTESQPHVNQLMVPIHHSPDQRVVGASALSVSLEVSYSRVKKMRENIANHVSILCGVFVPVSEPLSAAPLEGMEGTFGSTHDAAATLSINFVSASNIPPISTDDYEVAHADGQGGAGVGDETAAVDNMNLFVSNAELNISE
nr:hypothetical protein [Tanacetum cinerariifolium]